jgi:hypothetical protein
LVKNASNYNSTPTTQTTQRYKEMLEIEKKKKTVAPSRC